MFITVRTRDQQPYAGGETSKIAATTGKAAMNAETTAIELGTLHGETGHAPYGCLSDAGSARLMDALGQHGPTTQATHDFRLFLLDSYVEAWEQAADRDYFV